MIIGLALVYYLFGLFTIKAYFGDNLWKYSWFAQQQMILVSPYYFIDMLAQIFDMTHKILQYICDSLNNKDVK